MSTARRLRSCARCRRDRGALAAAETARSSTARRASPPLCCSLSATGAPPRAPAASRAAAVSLCRCCLCVGVACRGGAGLCGWHDHRKTGGTDLNLNAYFFPAPNRGTQCCLNHAMVSAHPCARARRASARLRRSAAAVRGTCLLEPHDRLVLKVSPRRVDVKPPARHRQHRWALRRAASGPMCKSNLRGSCGARACG